MRMGAPMGIGGAIIALVLSLLFGGDIFSGGGPIDEPAPADETPTTAGGNVDVSESPAEKQMVQFVSFVLDNDQKVWDSLLPKTFNVQYQHAKLVLFRDATQTGCGVGQTAMGPFYCPEDQKVYIDLAFYEDLKRRFGAPGDFAQAYVIAHEIGHHVQRLLGTEREVREAMQAYPRQANSLSVALELQADCLAGVWGHATSEQRLLDQGDVEEALNAASAIGDDRIQKRTQGQANPETFTHGSSAQRVAWFKKGLNSGDPRVCNTFDRK
jgi:uncharacterized protein